MHDVCKNAKGIRKIILSEYITGMNSDKLLSSFGL